MGGANTPPAGGTTTPPLIHRPHRPETPRTLAVGLLSNVSGTLYTVPAKAKANFTFGHFQNTGADTETVEIKVTLPGGTARHIARVVLLTNEGFRLFDQNEELRLDAGAIITGVTTHASVVSYVLAGIEYLYS